MTDADRIERLEKVLAILITWQYREIGEAGVNQLLDMLTEAPAAAGRSRLKFMAGVRP